MGTLVSGKSSQLQTSFRIGGGIVFFTFFLIAYQLSLAHSRAQAPVIVNPLTTLHRFQSDEGHNPYGRAILASDSHVYGTTIYGGTSDGGTAYKLSPGGVLTTLCSMSGSPWGGLLEAQDGNFYGTTAYGGGTGTVFKITPTGTLSNICYLGGTRGSYPYGALIQGVDGNLYGAAAMGGASDKGAIFKVMPSGTLSALCSLSGSGRANASRDLTQGVDGNFYGTTVYGGSGYGTVFKVTSGGVLTTLCSFTSGNGANPQAGVVQGSDGNFYGTTYAGGSGGYGTVFKVTSGGVLTTLCSFTGSNGKWPYAGLVQCGDGNFYGVTWAGGSSDKGTVFKITPGGVLTTLYSFTGSNGANPYATLTLGGDGNLYGTTAYSGTSFDGNGTVFKITPSVVKAYSGGAFSYQITATNFPTNYAASGLPSGLGVNTSTGLISGTPTVTGTFNVTISASNPDGVATASLVFVVATGLKAPEIISASNSTGTNGSPFSYQITASNYPTRYAASGLPSGLGVSTSTGLISGTPAVTGTFNVIISASNAGGTGTASLVVVIAAPAGAPQITSALSVEATSGFPFNYQITGTNGPIYYMASGLPSGLRVSTSTGLISGTPTVTGTFNATVSAINATGAGTASVTIGVVAPATPVITSSISATATSGSPFSYQIVATNYPTGHGASGLPDGLYVTSQTGFIEGTPTVTGTFSVIISASNVSGTGTASMAIVVVSPAAPMITSSLSASAVNGVAFSYQITATNYPTGYAASGLPSGLSIDGLTGLISGIPTETGTFNITISATNAGGTKSNNLILVVGVPSAPEIIYPFSMLYTFQSSIGIPYAGLIQARDGNFYGTATLGGSGNKGGVFKLTPDGVLTTLCSFNGSNGSNPQTALVEGSDGNLYGTTTGGGSSNYGTVFKITPSGILTTLWSFSGANGASPDGRLTFGRDGSLYGTTSGGGAHSKGAVYKITTSGVFTLLWSFNNWDGLAPVSGLTQGADDNFYGITFYGGSYNSGTIFKITPTGTLSTLYSFTGAPGYHPHGCLALGTDGNFYGTTADGGIPNGSHTYGSGTVYKITPTGTLTTLHSFIDPEGSGPYGGVIQARDGNFYGIAGGGSNGKGVLFRMTPAGAVTTLHSFIGSDGSSPVGEMVEGSDGNLYGTATTGGGGGNGIAYKLTACSIAGIQGGTISYQITAINNPTTYAANGLPAGMSVNTITGLISGSPMVSGTYSVIISATNGGGTANGLLVIGVKPASPVFVGQLDATAIQGASFNYQIVATNNPHAYAVSGLPPGLSVSTATGTIKGKPAPTGNFNVVLSATNDGGTAMANFELKILSPLSSFRTTAGLAADGSQDVIASAGDGVPNLFKYAFNMIGTGPGQSPTLDVSNHQPVGSSGTAGLPSPGVDEAGKLSVVFIRRKAATAPGVNYVVEFCDDLATNSWVINALATESATDIDSTFERVIVNDSVSNASKRFVRVRVTAP